MTIQHVGSGRRRDARVEYLLVHGFLTADLTFQPLASRSAFSLRQSERPAAREFAIELRDDDGRTLNRQPVAVFDPVVCFDHQSNVQIVSGRIALPREARYLLLFKGDILIYERSIPGAPSLSLKWDYQELTREKEYDLTLNYSKPEADAFLQFFYQWGERAYRSVGLLAPQKRLRLNVAHLPGGASCRWIVAYTSGMRTTVAASDSFSVPPRSSSLHIVRPQKKASFRPWQPITLEAKIVDDQDDQRYEDLAWTLNGKGIMADRMGCLPALPEGRYELVAQLNGREILTARRAFEVIRPKKTAKVPASEWN